MTGPPVLAFDLLDCPIVSQPPQYPRDDLLVQTERPLDGGERDGLGAAANGFADADLSLRELKAVGAGAHRHRTTGHRHTKSRCGASIY